MLEGTSSNEMLVRTGITFMFIKIADFTGDCTGALVPEAGIHRLSATHKPLISHSWKQKKTTPFWRYVCLAQQFVETYYLFMPFPKSTPKSSQPQ